MNQKNAVLPRHRLTADIPLFWLVCCLPVRTQPVKGAFQSTTPALYWLGACWYYFISQNKQHIQYIIERIEVNIWN